MNLDTGNMGVGAFMMRSLIQYLIEVKKTIVVLIT
jgi:hypothetical protein